MDPITIMAGASAAFNAIKKGIEVGRGLQDMSGQLSQWAGAMSDLGRAETKAKNPPWWKSLSGGVEQEAIQIFAAKKKAEEEAAALALQGKEQQYKTLIAQADDAFNSKNYGIAHYSNGAIGLGFFIFGIIVLFNFLKIDKTKYVLFFYYFFAMAIMFIFQSYLRYIYFLLAPLIYLLVISINNNLKEKKIILFTLFLILSVNVIKYDKISVALKDDINIYLSKDNLINYDLEQQPLKRLGNYINKTAAFENKKIFILSKYNQPQYYHFDTKVDFWTWHSLSIQLEIINSGNLEKSLKKKDFHYLVLENNFDAKILSQFIRDDIQKIGEFHSKYENFIIKKLN